jgi:hypothetical protein
VQICRTAIVFYCTEWKPIYMVFKGKNPVSRSRIHHGRGYHLLMALVMTRSLAAGGKPLLLGAVISIRCPCTMALAGHFSGGRAEMCASLWANGQNPGVRPRSATGPCHCTCCSLPAEAGASGGRSVSCARITPIREIGTTRSAASAWLLYHRRRMLPNWRWPDSGPIKA